MSNKLIGIISNEGTLKGVIEDDNFNVKVQITESGPKGDKGDPFVYDDFTPTQLEGLTGPQGPQGPKGDKGDKGDIGEQGPQGNDGYTPIKGIDYFDGIDGEQGPKGDKGDKGDTGDKGESGVYVGSGDMPEDYNVQIDPNGEGETLQDMIDSALLEAKNSGEFKGDTGEKGEKGTDGKDGYTPQKGVDYWTDTDKSEMVSAVLSALPVYEGEVESV